MRVGSNLFSRALPAARRIVLIPLTGAAKIYLFPLHPALLFSENPSVDYREDKNARKLLKEIKSIIENYLAESP